MREVRSRPGTRRALTSGYRAKECDETFLSLKSQLFRGARKSGKDHSTQELFSILLRTCRSACGGQPEDLHIRLHSFQSGNSNLKGTVDIHS